MAAEPHHHHETDSFYIDQLCMIGICGAFAAICLTLYYVRVNMLQTMFGPLNETLFGDFILWSGIALLILVVLRAVAVWRSVGNPALRDLHAGHDHDVAHHPHMHPHEHHHDHAHEHGPCGHDHDHANCGHDHDPMHQEKSAGAAAAHVHDHGHTHDHDPEDHDHGWAPWRYAVLLVPIALYLLGLPNQGRAVKDADVDTTQLAANYASTIALGPNPFLQLVRLGATSGSQSSEVRIVIDNKTGSIADLKKGMKVFVKEAHGKGSGSKIVGSSVEEIRDESSATGKTGLISGTVEDVHPEEKSVTLTLDRQGIPVKERINLAQGPVFGVDFKTLEAFALDETRRNKWEGKMVQVVGQFAPYRGSTQLFSLARWRIQCCAADAVQLNVPIFSAEPITRFESDQWVQVTARVEFRQRGSRWNTMLVVDRKSQVKSAPPEPDLYIR